MKSILFFFTLILANNSKSQIICDSILIDEYTMTFNSFNSHNTPLLDINKLYRLEVNGRYGFADGWSHNDAAWNYAWDLQTNTKVFCNGTQDPFEQIVWMFNNMSNFERPDNDTHNNANFCSGNDKKYFWTISGLSGVQTLSFIDYGGYGDNSGQLHFKLYELITICNAPSNLVYNYNPVTYYSGIPIQNNIPLIEGTPTFTYSVNPALPAGLNINTGTGIISGTPSVISPSTDYTVSVSNCCGNTSTVINITVENFSNNLPYYIPSDGLICWYPFNGNANDESGNGHHGTVHGADLVSDRFGNLNNCYNFDGINDYISGNCSDFPSAERTVSFLVNCSLGMENSFFFGYGGGSCGTSFNLYGNSQGCGPQGLNGLSYSSHCCVDNFNCSSQSFGINEWNLLTFTTSASGTKIYLNAVKLIDYNGFINYTNVVSKEFIIGAIVNYTGIGVFPGAFLNGKIDEVAIWNRELTQSEIQELYGGSFCEIPYGLIFGENPVEYCLGTSIPDNIPTIIGTTPIIYSISPSLPLGINIDPNTGIISGTPSVPATTDNYTVTAANTCGSTSAIISITVNDLVTYYEDNDNDTYGNPLSSQISCTQPLGYVINNYDCDDANANINPGAIEICDGSDNNCDQLIDNLLIYNSANPGNYNEPSTWEGGCIPPNQIPNNVSIFIYLTHHIVNPSGNIITNNGIINCSATFLNNGIYQGNGTFNGIFINSGTVKPGNN